MLLCGVFRLGFSQAHKRTCHVTSGPVTRSLLKCVLCCHNSYLAITNPLFANRYAADQLTWLVTRSLGTAPMEIMAKLQEDIDECDRKGGRNASIEADENIDDWVSLVAAGGSRQDVEEVVLPLLQQA